MRSGWTRRWGAPVGRLNWVHYMRCEMASDIEPRLQRIRLQIDNPETPLNLALVTRYALAGRDPQEPTPVLLASVIPPRPRPSNHPSPPRRDT